VIETFVRGTTVFCAPFQTVQNLRELKSESYMRLIRSLTTGAAILALTALAAQHLPNRKPSAADGKAEMEKVVRDYLAEHPEDIQRIVKDYLVRIRACLQEQIVELQKMRQATANPRQEPGDQE